MPPKNKKDYYSVPSEQLTAFAKAIAPYLSNTLKDIGSETTVEDILKRVQLGSKPGGIQAVFSDSRHPDLDDRGWLLGEYNYRYMPFVDYHNLYKDKRAGLIEQGLVDEDIGEEEFDRKLKDMTSKSKFESEMADTIRLFINPDLKKSDKGIDHLYRRSVPLLARLIPGLQLGSRTLQEKVEVLAHELMHTPSYKIDPEPVKRKAIRITSGHSEGFGPTSQSGYDETIKKHIRVPTAEVGRWHHLDGNKRKYIPPENRLFRSFKYEYEPGYERDKNPEKSIIDILSGWAEQGE